MGYQMLNGIQYGGDSDGIDVEANGNTLKFTGGGNSVEVKLANQGSSVNAIRFGIDADGNYGYYKVGADTVTPFITKNKDEGDLFNHGNIIGSHYPMAVSGGNTNNIVGILDSHFYTSSGYFKMNNEYIQLDYSCWKVGYLCTSFKTKDYKKVHAIVEVSSGASGNYNNSYLCICKPNMRRDASGAIFIPLTPKITDYITKTNYNNISPWNTFSKQEIVLDIPQSYQEEYFTIAFFNCDCVLNIYSLWLE